MGRESTVQNRERQDRGPEDRIGDGRDRNSKGKNSAEQGDRLGDGRDRDGTGKNSAE